MALRAYIIHIYTHKALLLAGLPHGTCLLDLFDGGLYSHGTSMLVTRPLLFSLKLRLRSYNPEIEIAEEILKPGHPSNPFRGFVKLCQRCFRPLEGNGVECAH